MGSNIDPKENLGTAAAFLRSYWPRVTFSSVYRTAPREVTDQPDFLNAVARIETDQSPKEVLSSLKDIEAKLGKAPPYRYGPRTIDLDLLLYDDLIHPNEQKWQSYKREARSYTLIVPHLEMHKRRFVLEPLCELANPQTVHPLLKESWNALLKRTRDQPCSRIPFSLDNKGE